MTESEDDRLWREHGEREGWTLPFVAMWPLRLPGVRIERRQDGVEYAALTINDPLCGPLNFHAYPFRAETFRG